jgi:hypothetical protein
MNGRETSQSRDKKGNDGEYFLEYECLPNMSNIVLGFSSQWQTGNDLACRNRGHYRAMKEGGLPPLIRCCWDVEGG